MCVQNCSTDFSVLNSSGVIPDHRFFVDFGQTDYRTSCDDHRRASRNTLEIAIPAALRSGSMNTALVHMHVVMNGGYISEKGLVMTSYGEIIPVLQCSKSISKPSKARLISARLCVAEVFVATETPIGANFYHIFIEQMTRVTAFLPFFKANPDIHIHVAEGAKNIAPIILKIFDLKNKVVSGNVRAGRIYLPQGGGCHNPNTLSVWPQDYMSQIHRAPPADDV